MRGAASVAPYMTKNRPLRAAMSSLKCWISGSDSLPPAWVRVMRLGGATVSKPRRRSIS